MQEGSDSSHLTLIYLLTVDFFLSDINNSHGDLIISGDVIRTLFFFYSKFLSVPCVFVNIINNNILQDDNLHAVKRESVEILPPPKQKAK